MNVERSNFSRSLLPISGKLMEIAIVEALCESQDDAFVKAGTIGSRVTARQKDGFLYNKPIIQDCLRQMSSRKTPGDSWPELEFDPQQGGRISMSNRKSALQRVEERRIVQSPPQIDGMGKHHSIFPADAISSTFRRYGNLWMSPLPSVTFTRLRFPNCNHGTLHLRDPVGPRCSTCGVLFARPIDPTAISNYADVDESDQVGTDGTWNQKDVLDGSG